MTLDSLHKDLGNCSFIRRPCDTVSVLCEQCLSNVSKLLDKHAPLVTHTFAKQATSWLSDSYRLAKTIRRQLERIWCKYKLAYNHRQIAQCNLLVNKAKANYFKNLVRENTNDSNKLWQVQMQYSLLIHLLNVFADRLVTFFRKSFFCSDTFTLPPPTDVPNFSYFKQVSQEDIKQIIIKSPIKFCLLHPWPTFLSRNV